MSRFCVRFVVFCLLGPACGGSGGSGDTDTSGGGSTSGSITTGPGEAGAAQSGPSQGGSSEPGSSSSGGDEGPEIPETCGDNVLDPDEACDDGNAIDEDGCNLDCVVSGSLLWSWMPPKGETLRAAEFSPADALWVATEVDTQISVRLFDRTGQPGEIVSVPGLPPPADRSDPSPAHVDIELGDIGPYVGLGYEWLTPNGFELGGRVQRIGADGWTHELEDGMESLRLRADSEGVYVVSRSSIVEAIDPDGTTAWLVSPDVGNINDIRTTAGGLLLVAARGITEISDVDGSIVWEYDPMSDVTWVRGDVGPEALWIWAGPGVGTDGALMRLSPEGRFLELLALDNYGDKSGISPGGFVVRARDGGARLVEKFTLPLDVSWSDDFGIGSWQDLDLDSRGGVALMTDWELRVFAP